MHPLTSEIIGSLSPFLIGRYECNNRSYGTKNASLQILDTPSARDVFRVQRGQCNTSETFDPGVELVQPRTTER